MARFDRIAVVVVLGLAAWSASFWLCDDRVLGESSNFYALHPGVCLDPGHGGPGACQWGPPRGECTNGEGHNEGAGTTGPMGLREAWVNHEIVPLAADDLEMDDVYVRCTRETITEDISYQRRCDIANGDPNVDVFISVHHEGDTRVYDTRTYYADTSVPNPETGEWRYKLALGLADEINRRFGYGMQVKDDTQTVYGRIEVLHSTWMPAALTEASCIGHALEENLMAFDAGHRQEEALGIHDGYFAYADTFTCPQNFGCYYAYNPYGVSYYTFWWNSVEGADGYVLYQDSYSCPPTPLSTLHDVGSSTSCDFPDWMVEPYDCFAVRAYVGGYQSGTYVGGVSDFKYSEQCPDIGIDRQIRNFTATGGDHRVTLDWEAIDFEDWTEFEIWKSTNGGQYYGETYIESFAFDPEQEDYSYVDTTTDYHMDYHYRIFDTEGHDWWGPVFGRPLTGVLEPPAPSPPPELAVEQLGNGYVRLCLEQGSEYAAYYEIQWMPEGGAWADSTHSGEACVDWAGLDSGTPYAFRARGGN
jgi:N-acetylmuramoyl-L-alanine amidase